jgi:hypothetical protein
MTHAKSSFAVYKAWRASPWPICRTSPTCMAIGFLMAREWFKRAEDADDMPSQSPNVLSFER